MRQALALVAVPLLLWACGGGAASEPPPETAADAPPPAAEPAPAAPADATAGGDEAWSGEEAAKAEKVPPGAEGKTETRTMELIAKIVKDNRQPVRDCMDKAKKELPDLK